VGEGLVQVGLHGRFNLALVHQQRLNPGRLQPLVGRPPHAARQQYLAVGHHGQLLLEMASAAMAMAMIMIMVMVIVMVMVMRMVMWIIMEMDVAMAMCTIVRMVMFVIMIMVSVRVARFVAQFATHKRAVDQLEYGAVARAPEMGADGFIIVGNHRDFHFVLQI
jgi:hypothetical protein